MQAWAACARSDETLILVDFANAYNSLDRQKMLEAIAAEAPSFLRYANFCYGAATPLRGRDFLMWSEEGTQQGDCCGHIVFSVVEIFRGKPISSKTMQRWIVPFLILLVLLFIYLTYQDVIRLLHRLF